MTLLGSAAYFGFGGFFAASLANALRGYPVLRTRPTSRLLLGFKDAGCCGGYTQPQMHLAYSVVGAVVGYGFYSLESTHNKSASALKEKHEALLAGQYTEVKAQLGEETHH